jgi:hypothetical protein
MPTMQMFISSAEDSACASASAASGTSPEGPCGREEQQRRRLGRRRSAELRIRAAAGAACAGPGWGAGRTSARKLTETTLMQVPSMVCGRVKR